MDRVRDFGLIWVRPGRMACEAFRVAQGMLDDASPPLSVTHPASGYRAP